VLALVAGQTVTQGFSQLRSEGIAAARRSRGALAGCVNQQKKTENNRAYRK